MKIVIGKQPQIAELAETVPSCNYCVATIVARPLRSTVKGGRQPSGRKIRAYFPGFKMPDTSDFNMPDACWISHSATTASSQAVIDNFDSLNYVQLVTEPTHICGNTLDFFVTVNVERDHFTSDHYPVTVIFHVFNSKSITSDLPNDIPIYSKNTFNIVIFMNSLVIFDCLFQGYFQMIPTDFYLAWYDI